MGVTGCRAGPTRCRERLGYESLVRVAESWVMLGREGRGRRGGRGS